MPATLIFDYGGVIVTDGFWRLIPALEQRFGVTEKQIWDAYEKTKSPKFMEGTMTARDRWEPFLKLLKITSSLEEFLVLYHRIFQPFPGMIEVLKQLKKNYRLGLISNQSKDTLKYHTVEHKDILALFDFSVYSCEVFVKKPNVKIYEIALHHANNPPENCIFIDDKKENLITAKHLGMKTVLFKNPKQLLEALKKLGLNMLGEE